MNVGTLEDDYPDIYENGPTPKMYAKWGAEWGPRRLPWSGEYPGVDACREFGFWCVGPPWVSVPAGTPGATEDLNRLMMTCIWDAEKAKWVRRVVKPIQQTTPADPG